MLESVLLYGAATLVATLIGAYVGLPSFFTLPVEGRGAVSVLIGVATAAAIVLGGRWCERHAWYARMADFLAGAVRGLLGPKPGATDALIVALASAMGEESVFRGLCQPGLARLLARHASLEATPALAIAILATSVSFTLLHPPTRRELRPWTFFAFVMGVAWGLLAAWSGSLAGPFVSHFLVNFLNLRRLLSWPLSRGAGA
jgi:membrane protease YdiL (CAAX protease family)